MNRLAVECERKSSYSTSPFLARARMIVVTGGTGHSGSELVRLLSAKGAFVRAVTRDTRKVQPPPRVKWVKGDLRHVQSLPDLFRGADEMFLLTSSSEAMRTLPVNALEAAKMAGVTHVVKMSA